MQRTGPASGIPRFEVLSAGPATGPRRPTAEAAMRKASQLHHARADAGGPFWVHRLIRIPGKNRRDPPPRFRLPFHGRGSLFLGGVLGGMPVSLPLPP